MVTKKPVSWLLTERGRQFSYALITGVGVTFGTLKFVPHTFFIEKYKDFVRYYNNGKPVDLPQELSARCQQCMDLLNLSEVHRKLVSPFSVYGYDLFHAGSSSSKFGVAVGIPVNFNYKSIKDVQEAGIRVNQKEINWESEAGQKLADALVLPEKVQQFAICREILMCTNNKVLFEASYPLICTLFVYNVTHYCNQRLNLYKAPALVRGTLYMIVGTFGLGLYFLMKDMTEVYYETQADKKLCELGPDFVESGVVFYNKLLKRNQALRELMGSEGERKYSVMGNENFFLRQPRLALVHRKQFFESMLEAKDSDSEEE